MAQPQFDRQKSCFECARSKARCDLEVPSCGRCRARGKHCVYGARSGNPNVRRQRDSANPPANLAGMTIATGPHHGDMGVGPSGGSPFAWAPGGDAAYYSDSSHGSIPTTPGSIHSGDESSSDSGAGWADASQVPYGGPRTHGYTASSASLPMQPSLGPYAGVPGPIPGPSHGIPQGMGGSVDQAPVVTPTTYMTRHSHDPSMPSGGRLITDLDRSAPAYKTEDGEETPIGRIVSSFAAGPSSMSARAPEPDFDARSRSVMGPPTHLPSHPQHHPHQQHPMMQQQHAGPSHHFQQQQHQPHQPHALPHATQPHQQQQHIPSSGWIPPPQNPYAPMSSSPLHHHHAASAGQLMGPPLGLPHRSTASLGPTTSSGSDGSAAGHFASPTRSRSQQRPQPHRLLTGAAMPQPPPSMTGNNAGAGGMHMPPPSGKPLFSAMVDLSGWLEDPVVPSPLYPTGPSMAPFAPSGAEPGTSGSMATGDVTTQQAQQPQASLDTMMQSDEDSAQQQQQQQQPDATSQPSSQMPASRYWWAHPPSQSDYTLMQGVAQASANHLSHYPALMVLPEPSSPVPPTVHRPWMAMMRGAIPPYLAIARVVLAGYAVRLPASEAVVWESVGRETRRIVECHEAICSRATSDLDVFGATQSLFFYCILLMMCNDAGAVGHVDVALTNSAFFGLSQLAKTLSGRVQMAQQQLQQQQQSHEGKAGGGTADEWMEWGFVETMRRTVWAAYAMLVLQRYRDSADMSQGRLAGVDLILDLELPAPALEFEAGTLEDWNKARAALYGGGQKEEGGEGIAVETGNNNGHGRSINRPTLTFRDLLRYRPSSSSSTSTGNGIDTTASNSGDAITAQGNSADPTPPTTSSSTSSSGAGAGGAPKELLDYFERHDAFVATVLSIAFCLDASLTAA